MKAGCLLVDFRNERYVCLLSPPTSSLSTSPPLWQNEDTKFCCGASLEKVEVAVKKKAALRVSCFGRVEYGEHIFTFVSTSMILLLCLSCIHAQHTVCLNRMWADWSGEYGGQWNHLERCLAEINNLKTISTPQLIHLPVYINCNQHSPLSACTVWWQVIPLNTNRPIPSPTVCALRFVLCKTYFRSASFQRSQSCQPIWDLLCQ